MKNYLIILSLLFISACGNKDYKEMNQYVGFAQGTTFSIVYDKDAGDLKADIDQIIQDMDKSMSLWDSGSHISKINNSLSPVDADAYFSEVFLLSEKIHTLTEGAFNPCLFPLIKYWGFAKDRFHEDSLKQKSYSADSLLKYSQWGSVKHLGNHRYQRMHSKSGIDFNAIAQGYTVDVIARMFDAKQLENYMIEVGGEVRAKGKNQQGKIWRIGIDKPINDSTTRSLQAIVELDGLSIATSGSYRKFYEKDGHRYSHAIDAHTGMPVEHRLLSVSVIAPTSAEADAYATAFLVMGAPKTVSFLNKHPELGLMVYLISDGFDGAFEVYMSPQLEERINNPNP